MTRGNTTDDPSTDLFDAVCIGETMVALTSRDDPRVFSAGPAGAESNVAVGMARLGCTTQWVSRLGDDPFGRLVEAEVAAAGVDVAVVRDDVRPTGVMVKHITGSDTLVRYYRSESAARALGVADLERAGPARWIHVTGITPALSASAAGLVEAVVARRSGSGRRVSFDVNLRPALWPDSATAAAAILPLAQHADTVFIGDDEAESLFGTSDAEALAALIVLRDSQELVLKRGARGASMVTRDEEISERALSVEVVDLTGAGDAFAAGYLAACCFGWPARDRLRLGHLMGSRVVGVLGDVVPPFADGDVAALSPEALEVRWSGI